MVLFGTAARSLKQMNVLKTSEPSEPPEIDVHLLLEQYMEYEKRRRKGMKVLFFVSLVLSAIIYSYLLGVTVGVGILLMLMAHEGGHMYAMSRIGLGGHLPLFIPFVGAVITYPLENLSSDEEAYVAYMGPLIGTVAAALWTLFVFTWFPYSKGLLFIAQTGVFLNAFNMILPRPFDGGRILVSLGFFSRVLFILSTIGISLVAPFYLVGILWFVILASKYPQREASTCGERFKWLVLHLALLVFIILLLGAVGELSRIVG